MIRKEMRTKMKTLNEYLAGGGVFVLMSNPHITVIADKIDKYMNLKYGMRTNGQMITAFVDDNDKVSSSDREVIAALVEEKFRQKWGKYFDYIDAEVVPWTTGNTTTKVTYGKIVNDKAGGEDVLSRADGIAGFDSTDFVDSESREQKTKYGRTDESKQTGTDTIVVDTRSGQADALVDYTLQFWNKYGLMDMLARDCAKTLTLSIYNLD